MTVGRAWLKPLLGVVWRGPSDDFCRVCVWLVRVAVVLGLWLAETVE